MSTQELWQLLESELSKRPIAKYFEWDVTDDNNKPKPRRKKQKPIIIVEEPSPIILPPPKKPKKKTHLTSVYPPDFLLYKMCNEGRRSVCARGYVYITWLHFKAYEHSLVVRINNIEVPKGYAVHHIDRNKLNNNISNLRVMFWKDHFKEHHKRLSEKS